ncbi:MAG: hypothetical protein NC340_01070 [Ruminococcus flavefaciens]|nr:hypothetical protein [Ruminococcus flavefaciens]MCM1228737.1 hypothetical protein [Ruminococcus flavefaciens]
MKNIPELKIVLEPEQAFLVNKMIGEIGNPECRAVSFRMSRTLVSTPFSEREDLFLFMEDDFRQVYKGRKTFAEFRIYAEEKFPDDIDKIYNFIMKQAKLTQESRDMLFKRECGLFTELAFPRNFGRKLFGEAQRRKKKIIIVADTLYPRSVVANVLDRCGYSGYSELVVANELENTDIYEAVIEKSALQAKKILNIGGNVEEDVEKPIMKGSKALLLADTIPLMLKSGRLRGYIQAKHLYDYDSAGFLALHLAFGLYSAYMFDVPRNRVYNSDFCASPYMLGFIVFGTLRLAKDFSSSAFEKKLISAVEENEEITRGAEDFTSLFSAHFGNISNRLNYSGFSLPFEFFAKHGAVLDRNMLKLDGDTLKEWQGMITEPATAPVYVRSVKQNAVSRLADRMFPPGTRVRGIADGILVKMKQKAGFRR